MRESNLFSKQPPARTVRANNSALLASCVVLLCAVSACSGSDTGSNVQGSNGSSTGSSSSGAPNLIITGNGNNMGGTSSGSGGAGNSSAPGVYMLPAGFTKTDFGGYKLGDPIATTSAGAGGAGSDGDTGTSNCGTQILGVVRDFKAWMLEPNGHPDFEHYSGRDASLGIVKSDLGSDQKPVYSAAADSPFIDVSVNGDAANGQQTTNKMYFDEWYRATDAVNKPYIVYLYFQPNGNVLTFQSTAFFPLDGAGWGNTPGQSHNFSFTTEVHTRFNYNGGETFSFTGDDDLWVFINNTLAIDLGGLHPSQSKTISLDTQAAALGITKGSSYALDLFHAERHTTASDFRVDTNLEFTNCGTVIPEVPVK
jgi:fibro-slime domain-containing protein